MAPRMSLLQAHDVSVNIDSYRLLDKVSMELRANELVGLIGPNGAGKTTLLRALAKLLDVNTGAVMLDQVALSKITPSIFARRCAYLAQGAHAYWPLTVERVVALGRLPHLDWRQSLTDADHRAIEDALLIAEVQHLRTRTVTTLSGGERMRVLLARIFAAQPQIILADEPIAALDPYHQLHVLELLREHVQTKTHAALVVMHDLNLAARFCDRLILMSAGRIVCEGSPRDVLTQENLRAVYGVSARIADSGDEFNIVPWQRQR